MEKFYTPDQAAEALQTTRKTVYRWINNGQLNAVKAGSFLRIPESELQKFLIKINVKKED
jgi:excisionase family DNA binding protein